MSSVPAWKYKIEKIVVSEPVDQGQINQVQRNLNAFGAEGWEAVTSVGGAQVGHVFILFKRPAGQYSGSL
jgi:histidinol dehydrogenase